MFAELDVRGWLSARARLQRRTLRRSSSRPLISRSTWLERAREASVLVLIAACLLIPPISCHACRREMGQGSPT